MTSRHTRQLRWSVPAVVAAGIAVAAVLPGAASGSSPKLPPRTAAQLLAAVETAHVPGLSGTVVESARLGLPALPGNTGSATDLSWQSLVTGSHTARVWWAGPERQRVALLDNLAETDVVHDGGDAWTYSSASHKATHLRLPAQEAAQPRTPPSTLTPPQAAEQALRAVDPTTKVSVDRTMRVAGRPAYQLVLQPRDRRSLVTRVTLAVDSATSMPLRVQVFGSAADPAFETAFTDVSFAVPPAAVFRFHPPAGAKVTERTVPMPTRPRAAVPPVDSAMTLHGRGWTTVVEVRGAGAALSDQQSQALLNRLATPVSGGRLIRTALVTVLLRDDGRVFAGAVTPELLLQRVAADASTR